MFVKNFFKLFFAVFFTVFHQLFATACLYYHVISRLSTTFYNFFKKFFELINRSLTNGEGGIWTPAPLLTTCTLSRGVPSASLGTSPALPESSLSDLTPDCSSRLFVMLASNCSNKSKHLLPRPWEHNWETKKYHYHRRFHGSFHRNRKVTEQLRWQ